MVKEIYECFECDINNPCVFVYNSSFKSISSIGKIKHTKCLIKPSNGNKANWKLKDTKGDSV